jgi:hypothetical protein
MGWKLAVAALAGLIALDFCLPPSDSGPANASRYDFGIWLVVFLFLTLIAWAARGRWRSIIIWAMAAPIWLWLAYIPVATFLWPVSDKRMIQFTIGAELVLGLIAGSITAVGIRFWRKPPPSGGPAEAASS